MANLKPGDLIAIPVGNCIVVSKVVFVSKFFENIMMPIIKGISEKIKGDMIRPFPIRDLVIYTTSVGIARRRILVFLLVTGSALFCIACGFVWVALSNLGDRVKAKLKIGLKGIAFVDCCTSVQLLTQPPRWMGSVSPKRGGTIGPLIGTGLVY
ncbi:MAG: hypothetical protein H6510_09460 [Acidobacteria bacterium]|nr:hypothetical protein [Acidobacteriota bacterium]MCB9398032.1 hypothetical protein [Acidobacteriota bacterium]